MKLLVHKRWPAADKTQLEDWAARIEPCLNSPPYLFRFLENNGFRRRTNVCSTNDFVFWNRKERLIFKLSYITKKLRKCLKEHLVPSALLKTRRLEKYEKFLKRNLTASSFELMSGEFHAFILQKRADTNITRLDKAIKFFDENITDKYHAGDISYRNMGLYKGQPVIFDW